MRSQETGTWEEADDGLAESLAEIESVAPSLIVRHTSRRLGRLAPEDARERLISGSISFAEFVDQVGDGFRELLEFMTDNDLHPGRPDEVIYCIERDSHTSGRRALRTQLKHLYAPEHRRGGDG